MVFNKGGQKTNAKVNIGMGGEALSVTDLEYEATYNTAEEEIFHGSVIWCSLYNCLPKCPASLAGQTDY